jgi:pectate lyase
MQPILCINGPADFNKLCESLYYRQRVYANKTPTNGLLKAPLIILIKAGVYDASQTLSTIGANAYSNYMLDIAEQGDLTFLGEGNVVFKFGINVKRSYNIIIRNISFYDYHDDGVNVGYPETHHVWIDHCTFGHPTTLPVDPEDPDGTSEVKDGASFVTISWCKYRNHWKTCLLGHSDNNGATDLGRLKVTYYANYFYSTNSRHPRTRFGTVHVLNNLYENVGLGRTGGLGYGIGASNNSQVWAEGNFFLDTRWPMTADRSIADFAAVYGANLVSPNSNIQCYGLKSVNNEYDDSGLTQSLVGKVAPAMLNPSGLSIKFDELTTPNFTYKPMNDYNYTADLLPASAVRTLIPIYAGADKINWNIGCTTPVGVADNEGVLNNLKITPSVSSDFLTIETTSNETTTLTVVDVFGRIVMTKKITISENKLKIANLPNGVYSVILSNSSGRSVGKFVKQ